MVYFRIKCIAGIGCFTDSRETFHHLSPFKRIGDTNAFVAAFIAYYTYYYIVRETHGTGELYSFVAGRVDCFCFERDSLFAFDEDVATCCCKCSIGCRLRFNRSSFHRIDFTFLCRQVSDETVWLELCHYKYYIGFGYYFNRLSGRSKLALAFYCLSLSVDLAGAYFLFKRWHRSFFQNRTDG